MCVFVVVVVIVVYVEAEIASRKYILSSGGVIGNLGLLDTLWTTMILQEPQ